MGMLLYHIVMQYRNKNNEASSVATSQMHLDDQYDEKIADFSRQSIFLKVDGTTLRQAFRESLSEGNSNVQITAPHESYEYNKPKIMTQKSVLKKGKYSHTDNQNSNRNTNNTGTLFPIVDNTVDSDSMHGSPRN